MNRFAVVLWVLGLWACASTREQPARLTQEPDAELRTMALATPTASEAVTAVASPSPETIRAHGLLDPAALSRVSRKAGQEPRLMRARARAALPLTPRNINARRVTDRCLMGLYTGSAWCGDGYGKR